ncbi:hypothetical protein ACFFJ4_22215 [Xanthomonas dyei]|uniref:hypothetical protein n=1 Tax=Xanthomonas dyei TaxID=743699 RepID=UPI0011B03825|nr:hypothetical protein [Xanthomonas dyei]
MQSGLITTIAVAENQALARDLVYSRRRSEAYERVVQSFPSQVISKSIKGVVSNPIGGTSIMYSHSTIPGMSQKYRVPIWDVPDHVSLSSEDRSSVAPNRDQYIETKASYTKFAKDVMARLEK